MITSNGYKTTLKANIKPRDQDAIRYALASYAFVNGTIYSVSIADWIKNIKATYDESIERHAYIIATLSRYA